MYNFIVGGFVPGTNLQVTFQLWLDLTGVAVVVYMLHQLLDLRQLLDAYLATRQPLPVRAPLHANQLHRRA
jgi:hypothetical protein